MTISRQEALLAAGVDTSKGNENGKFQCPRCGEYGVWNKKGSDFCKCFAHGGCGWKYPTKKDEQVSNPIKDALNRLAMQWHDEMAKNKECGFRNRLVKYLTKDRGIHGTVLANSKIGMVPNTYDPKPVIEAARKAVATDPDKKKREAALATFEENFATPLVSICKSREGWMVFPYEDWNGNVVGMNFRQIEKDEQGKNVVRMWNPLGYRGVFNPFVGGYTVRNRVLVTEGEFNQLQLLSAYVRLHGKEWMDEALCCVTVGASAGVDHRTLWGILREMAVPGENLVPVVNEDNDVPGQKVTERIAEGGFTYHFKLPPKDLDEYVREVGDEEATSELVESMAEAPIYYRPMEVVRTQLDYIRCNPPLEENGVNEEEEPNRLPEHRLNRKIYEFVERDVQTRAELFLSTFPYLYLRENHKLIRFHADSPSATEFLKDYGLLRTEAHTKLVQENLQAFLLLHSKQIDVHKLGCIKKLGGNHHACYVNKGDGQMYRITPDEIEVVQNGTDDVFVLDEKLLPWPDLTPANLAYVAEVGEKLGNCGLKVADTPLCHHFRALYEKQPLSQSECEQLSFTRFMFHWVANSVSLWPLEVNIGVQNAGKSTKFEKFQKLLYGRQKEGSKLPKDLRSLIAGLTNSPVTLYDNIDSAEFAKAQAEFLDIFCGCATGMEASMAELYKNNIELRFNLRNHVKLTSRVSPFNRSDAMRRVIQLTIRKPTPQEWVDKDVMMDNLVADRDKCLIEILVRLQNIVHAYDRFAGKRYEPESEMPEYEVWTYRCAEYEGWQSEMRAIWKKYMSMYEDAIQENNPMAYGIKLWLGEDKGLNPSNAGREVSVSTLWAEFNRISGKLGLKHTYKSASSFGKNITKNLSELRTLGYQDNGFTGGKKRIWFNPSPEQMKECSELHRDLKRVAQIVSNGSPLMEDSEDDELHSDQQVQ